MQKQNLISRQVRQDIFDGLRLWNLNWFGAIEDIDFLRRIYNLKEKPSTDSRYSSAEGDIFQHRINNFDWEDDWIFSDPRFDLLGCPDEQLITFLIETIHPIVRPEVQESQMLASHYNDQLKHCGWNILPKSEIAGRTIYSAVKSSDHTSANFNRVRSIATVFDSQWMKQEIDRIENSINSDPANAIGTAKDLVETVCKNILDAGNIGYSTGSDLPTLTKLASSTLRLVPNDISEQSKGANSIKLILQNFSTLTHHLAALRGLYGSGHGKSGNYTGMQPRHARLAVSAAIAYVEFVFETHLERIDSNG